MMMMMTSLLCIRSRYFPAVHDMGEKTTTRYLKSEEIVDARGVTDDDDDSDNVDVVRSLPYH